MARTSYKSALRAKGIKPIPPYHRLRSFKSGDKAIDATASAIEERKSK